MSKTYTKRTNAKRAAIAAGIPADQVEIVVSKEAGKSPRFGFKKKEAKAGAVAPRNVRGHKAKGAAAPKGSGPQRPRAGGKCAQVWDWLDKRGDATLAEVKAWALKSNGVNVNNAACELYAWRKWKNAQEVMKQAA